MALGFRKIVFKKTKALCPQNCQHPRQQNMQDLKKIISLGRNAIIQTVNRTCDRGKYYCALVSSTPVVIAEKMKFQAAISMWQENSKKILRSGSSTWCSKSVKSLYIALSVCAYNTSLNGSQLLPGLAGFKGFLSFSSAFSIASP